MTVVEGSIRADESLSDDEDDSGFRDVCGAVVVISSNDASSSVVRAVSLSISI